MFGVRTAIGQTNVATFLGGQVKRHYFGRRHDQVKSSVKMVPNCRLNVFRLIENSNPIDGFDTFPWVCVVIIEHSVGVVRDNHFQSRVGVVVPKTKFSLVE